MFSSFIRHPRLALEGMRAAMAVAPNGWWRRPPFLPIPDPAYMAWRRETAYGDKERPIDAEDLAHYLAWRHRYRQLG